MSFIQNLFTSRDNQTSEQDGLTGNLSTTYIGQQDRLWWNPDTNALYYSDGSTPGGIPVGGGGGGNGVPGGPTNSIQYNAGGGNFGGSSNLTISGAGISAVGNITAAYFAGDGSLLTNLPLGNYTGNISGGNISITNTANLGNFTISDQTLSGTVTDRDVTIRVVGSANVNIDGPLNVHGAGNLESPPQFEVKSDGQSIFRIPVLDANLGAVQIIGTTSGVVLSPANPGGMLQITGQNNQVSRLYNDAVNNYPLYVGRRYNGTALAPTGVLANQVISRLGANPYLTDTAGFTSLGTAQINFVATENQTTTAQGSKITMNTTPTGSNVQSQVAEFNYGGIILTGNLLPRTDDVYSLGNASLRWVAAHFGNAGIYIQDNTLGDDGQLQLDNGTLNFDNINSLRVGNLQFTSDGIITNIDPTQDVFIGNPGDTGNTVIRNAGIKFTDNTVQDTAAIPLTQKGNALGVVPLNASTKIDPVYLPAGGISFQGIWNANTNTPTLSDGTGTVGYEYIVGTAGTQNLGSGNITFNIGDFVLYTSANVWEDVPVGGTGVTSFNTRTGAVTLLSGDVTNALTTGSIVNSKLQNPNVTVTTGAGLSGGQVVPLGGTITLVNSGVTAAVAGTGVTVSAATGNVTFSIGQNVATNATVQFNAISSTTTIQATGNVTGSNLATGGRVVATGNIVTLANVVTPGTIINSSVSTSGNIIGANFVTGGLVTVTGNVTGGNILTTGQVSATGNGSFGNITVIRNANTANLNVTGISNLNSNANVKITGGTTGQLLSTDGTGNLLWISSGNIAPTSGTWTPTLVPETGSYTLTINNTYYQKIGSVTFCTFDITIASQSTPNGNVIMGNLPFTSASTAATTGSLAVSFYTGMNSPTNVVSGTVPGSANTVTMYWQGSSDTKMDPLTHNRLKATTRLVGSVYYATV